MSGAILALQEGKPIPPGYTFLGTSVMTVRLPNGQSRTLPVSIVGFEWVPELPSKVSLISPKTSVTSSTPTFSWHPVIGATYYVLRASQHATIKFERWYRPEQIGCPTGMETCSVVPDATLDSGFASWQVLAWNQVGYAPWSDTQEFSVDIPDPAALVPQPVSPSGAIATGNPVYTWTAVAGAVSYRLSLRNNNGPTSQWWFSPASAGCQTTTSCSVTTQVALQPGTAEWQVQSSTPLGHSNWSAPVR